MYQHFLAGTYQWKESDKLFYSSIVFQKLPLSVLSVKNEFFCVHFSLSFRLLFFMLAVLFLQEKLRIAFSFNWCMIQFDLKLLWHLYPVRFGELILQAICLQLTLESQWFPGISAWNIAYWPKISVPQWQCYQPVFHFHSLEPLHGILVC